MNIGTPLQAIKFALSDYFDGSTAGVYIFLAAWEHGDVSEYQPAYNEFLLANPAEPENKAKDGTVRQNHYGSGRQPWDAIVEQGWGPHFAAGNVLRYVRRDSTIKGVERARDLKHAHWYWDRLRSMQADPDRFPGIQFTQERLYKVLTFEERELVINARG